MAFLVVRSYEFVTIDKETLEAQTRRVTSETLFETKDEADNYIGEMVELNPAIQFDFFVKEI